jgi:hypothetical protein
MPSQEESRESGRAYTGVGWILVLFAVLLVFFEPAAFRLGQMRFGVIAVALVVIGLVLNCTDIGYVDPAPEGLRWL